MIITCNKCTKRFSIESYLIPEKGRLVQCSSCNHSWFFKKDTTKIISSVKTTDSAKINTSNEKKLSKNLENIELLDETINDDLVINNDDLVINKDLGSKNSDKNIIIDKPKKNYKILGPIIVFIISFISLIILVDTFQNPISKIVPNIEFLLYNLYESINDIKLFLNDLI
jgi:predicted Zn finger-like uncharacterized protein